eukprot:jgi/Chlat1/2146/Chrsp17S02729
MVCPMRVLLVVVSAAVASFLVWRHWDLGEEETTKGSKSTAVNHVDVIDGNSIHKGYGSRLRSTLLLVLDMATGRYLWHHIQSAKVAYHKD